MSEAPSIDPGFATAQMAALFSASARVRAFADFEHALATVQARLGIIPALSAAAIAAACASEVDDAEQLLREGWAKGTPVVPLLALLKSRLSPEHAAFLHFGATTQDAVDTATALQLRAALELLERGVGALAGLLRALADAHRDTPIIGRTLLQHAVPTSFGLTAAHWLTPLVGAARALTRARVALPVQLGGPVGALTGFDGRAVALLEGLAETLDLTVPTLPWHGDRTPITQAVQAVSLTVRAVHKLAGDLVLLAQTDVAELRMRGGGSSSMAHKHNPIDAVRAIAAGEACLHLSVALASGRAHELERAAGAWHMEWLFLPLVFYTGDAALEAAQAALESLEVDVARMRRGAGTDRVPDAANALIDRALAAADAQWGVGK